MMKKSLAMAAGIVAITGTAFATQPIPDDNFDALTIADLAGQNSWDQSGGASSPNVGVVAGSLTYTGYSAVATGNKVFLNDAGQDVGKSFAATLPVADGNTYYYSFLLQHDGTDTGSTTGDYLAHFTGGTAASGTAFRGRLFLGQDTVATSAKVGIRWGSADTVVYGSTAIPQNTTALIVVKLTEVPSTIPTGNAGNDRADVFVFLDPAPIPAVEPGTPTVTTTNGAANSNQDIADTGGAIGRIGFRQGNAANGAKVNVDFARVGTTWAEVTSPASGVANWSAFE